MKTRMLSLALAVSLLLGIPVLAAENSNHPLGFGFGALTHVFLDMCTSHGVPLLPFGKKRFSLKICSTGSFGEYAILIMCVLVFWIAKRPELLHFHVPLY